MIERRFIAATPLEVLQAGRVWARLFPHDRIAWYYLALGFFDPDQKRCKNDWYELDPPARVEIASQMIRIAGDFRD